MLRFVPIILNVVAGLILAIPQSFSDSAETPPPPFTAVAAPTVQPIALQQQTGGATVTLDPVGDAGVYLLSFTDDTPFMPNESAEFTFDFGTERVTRVGTMQDAFPSSTIFCILENARATCTNRANSASNEVADLLTVRFLLRIDRWPLNVTVTRFVDGKRIQTVYTIGGA